MFKASNSRGDLNGFLDAGSHMQGELHFEDTFRIDGRLTGGVVSDGDLIIGERGEIDGHIKVRRLFVSGIARGQLEATEEIEITGTGRVFADLDTPILKVEEGALFEGRCAMPKAKARLAREGKTGEAAPENVTPMAAARKRP